MRSNGRTSSRSNKASIVTLPESLRASPSSLDTYRYGTDLDTGTDKDMDMGKDRQRDLSTYRDVDTGTHTHTHREKYIDRHTRTWDYTERKTQVNI